MKFIKKNFKTIIAFVIGILLASSACIYAVYKYNSTDVVYEKQDGNEISVKSALDELYLMKENISFPSTPSENLDSPSTQTNSWDASYTFTEDKYVMIVTRTGSSGGNTTYIYKNGSVVTPNHLQDGTNGDKNARVGVYFIKCAKNDVIRFYSKDTNSGYTSNHHCKLYFNQ